MKKIILVLALFIFLLSSCTKPEQEVKTFTVTFDSNGGSSVSSQVVSSGNLAIKPEDPTLEGYIFKDWETSDSKVVYIFNTPVLNDITLKAVWEEEPTLEMTDQEKIEADILSLETSIFVDAYQLNLPIRGATYRSAIKWTSQSDYVSSTGYILPVPLDDDTTVGQITGEFSLNGVKVSHVFDIPLSHMQQVEITTTRVVPFTNLTTEYIVEDADVNLYFEDGGYVPYIKVVDFFSILDGFIDPAVEFTFTKGEGTLEIFYQYYDEDYDETYDLIVNIDVNENTITTNDPGFYWAYVYSTETNYGRHIEYDINNPDASSVEGENVVYDLDDYSLDMAVYEDDVVLPYYIVNQLFAGSSYYNVYYNYDGLYGIYSLPDSDSKEYSTIKGSSMNNKDIPADLLVHTFNMLAFDFDSFYGLKDIMEVDTYYDLLISQRNKLLIGDPEEFDYAIRDLLLKQIDEPHTSYGYSSYFNKATWTGPETNQLTNYGTRFTQWYYDGLVAVDDVLEAKWGVNPLGGWTAGSPSRPHYWFLDDVSVLLSLDDFYTADIEESATFNAALAGDVLKLDDVSNILPDIVNGTKYFFYNSSTEKFDQLDILVKGLDASYVATYGAALIALGYEFKIESTIVTTKQNGYYEITVQSEDDPLVDVSYMVQLEFDEDLDLFYLGLINRVPVDYASSWPLTVDVFETVNSDSAVYLEMMFDQILAISPNLENVMLDLSWNTGGNVGALYRIVGFITDQPFRVSSIDRDTGGFSSSYVVIDGVPNYSNLNWALLITPVTFSAANSMATIFMENELGPIIGKQSGGGACSITPILLPNGTAFTMSSNNINAYRTGTGSDEDPYVYHNNEFGITPDYPIDIKDIYDIDTLLQVFVD